MKHRIRSAAIIVRDNKVLLVKHVHPQTGFVWWVPPGGGIEEKDDSLFACAVRETYEETGLHVRLDNIQYVREFYDHEHDVLNVEFFMVTQDCEGDVTMQNVYGNGPDAEYIKEVRWLSRREMKDKVVFPEILKDAFWRDCAEGFPHVKYLGRQM